MGCFFLPVEIVDRTREDDAGWAIVPVPAVGIIEIDIAGPRFYLFVVCHRHIH